MAFPLYSSFATNDIFLMQKGNKNNYSPVPIWTDVLHTDAECGCCHENLCTNFVGSVQTTNYWAVTANAGAKLTRTSALRAKGCFFPPSPPPSFALAATEKRKFKDLGMCIFPAPHAYFSWQWSLSNFEKFQQLSVAATWGCRNATHFSFTFRKCVKVSA